MAHRSNSNFSLYSGLDANALKSHEAYTHLTDLEVNFKHMHYSRPSQIPEVLTNLGSWFPEEENLAFPLVTYEEVYDEEDSPNRVVRVINGLEAIKAADWAALTTFQG